MPSQQQVNSYIDVIYEEKSIFFPMARLNEQMQCGAIVMLLIMPFNNIALAYMDSRGQNFKFLLPFAIQLALIWFLSILGIGATIGWVYSLAHTCLLIQWNRKQTK